MTRLWPCFVILFAIWCSDYLKQMIQMNLKKSMLNVWKTDLKNLRRSWQLFQWNRERISNKITRKTKKEPPVCCTVKEDQEIRQRGDRFKELRKKENRSKREKVEYTELNKTVKRELKDHKRNEQILKLYFKVVEDQNRYKRRTSPPPPTLPPPKYVKWKIKRLKYKQTEIKHWWSAQALLELYSCSLQDQHPSQKKYRSRRIRCPTYHDIRSQENPDRNEKQQGPGHR